MTQGFKATLFAGVITFGVVASASAAAPVITGIPDITIGDVEGVDANEFVFEAPFSLNDYVDYDGDESELLWSFGESDSDGLATNQYTINGVGAAVSGDAALADEVSDGFPNTLNPATPIPVTASTTFRDIVLSPEGGPNQAPSDEETAAAGKVITYYVSNGEDVATAESIIRSVDGGEDSMTQSAGWDPVVVDDDFSSSGWVSSGQPSPGVTINKSTEGLQINVTPTVGLGRVYGWKHMELLDYDDVGTDKYVRGKFYISTSNPWNAPVNEVPGFRLRVTNADAVGAAAHFEYPQTALASPPHEPRYVEAEAPDAQERAGRFLRPSGDASTPSLYRVDFDPMDVPSAAGTSIGALIESYAYSDKANGILTLHEIVLGTYDALDDADGDLVLEYDRSKGLQGGAGGPKAMTGGQFNAEANFESGRRQTLYVPGADPAHEGPWAFNLDWSNEGLGLIASTRGTRTDRFAMNLLNVMAADNADRLRVEPGKLYKAKFYALAILPATSPNPGEIVQGNMRFRFQTAGNTLSYLYELLSPAGLDLTGSVAAIAAEAIPSSQSQNPETDSNFNVDPGLNARGGWYTLLVPSPLDADGIRKDQQENDTTGGNGFGVWGIEPGPGAGGDSLRDVQVGVDLIQAPTHLVIDGGVVYNFSRPNHSEIGIQAIHVYEYPSIDDGGYEYDDETPALD